MEWSKHLPFVKFAISKSDQVSTSETPFYASGLRHPRIPVSFVRSPNLSGGGPPTTLGANTESANIMAETRFSDPVSAAVVTTQESVKSESRHTLSVLQINDDRSSLAATTHGQPIGDVIGELNAKTVREAQLFLDERSTITRKGW